MARGLSTRHKPSAGAVRAGIKCPRYEATPRQRGLKNWPQPSIAAAALKVELLPGLSLAQRQHLISPVVFICRIESHNLSEQPWADTVASHPFKDGNHLPSGMVLLLALDIGDEVGLTLGVISKGSVFVLPFKVLTRYWGLVQPS